MASTTRKPSQSAAAKAALDANAAAVTAEKLTQPDNGLTTSDAQSAVEATAEPRFTDAEKAAVRNANAAIGGALDEQVAPALAERRRIAAEAKAKREAEKAAVAERAEAVAAEQAANPTPPKKKVSNEAAEAKRKANAERVAKVIEMRKDGKKLGEIAEALGYTSQQVVSSVLRRHAPDLQVQRVAGTGGMTLTPEQVTELRELETRYDAKLATITKALARAAG